MKPFSKSETVATAVILFLILAVSSYNFVVAIRKGRDVQRKNDIRTIADALNKYNDDFGFYPGSSPVGEIVACAEEERIKDFVERAKKLEEEGKKASFSDLFNACEWGEDALKDIVDPNFPPYLDPIPTDPQRQKGIKYHYLSNGRRFQILAYLEGKSEDEYDEDIHARGISCGAKVCNFGRSSGDTPLDRSIEKYENELLEKTKN